MHGPPSIRRALLGVGTALLLPFAAHADEQCAQSLSQFIQDVQTTIESLHPGEPDQFRVMANDGSEYTSSNVRWMQGELRRIIEACSRGRDVEAAWRLEQLQGNITAARKAALPQRSCQATSRVDASCALAADMRSGRRTMNVEPTPSRLSANTSP